MKLEILCLFIFLNSFAYSQNLEDLIKDGNSYLKERNYQLAIENYNKVLEIKPKIVGIQNNRGYAYLMLKKYGLALDDFNKVIKIAPEWSYVYYLKGYARLQILEVNELDNLKKEKQKKEKQNNQGDFVYSEKTYNHNELDDEYKQRKFKGKEESTQKLTTNDFKAKKDYEGGLKDFSKYIELEKKKKSEATYIATSYFLRGFCKYKLKDFEGGCQDFNEAVKLGLNSTNKFISYYCD